MGFEGLEVSLKLSEQDSGSFRGDFVLNDYVRPEGLAVLRGQVIGEAFGEAGVEAPELAGGEAVGYSLAEGLQAGYL